VGPPPSVNGPCAGPRPPHRRPPAPPGGRPAAVGAGVERPSAGTTTRGGGGADARGGAAVRVAFEWSSPAVPCGAAAGVVDAASGGAAATLGDDAGRPQCGTVAGGGGCARAVPLSATPPRGDAATLGGDAAAGGSGATAATIGGEAAAGGSGAPSTLRGAATSGGGAGTRRRGRPPVHGTSCAYAGASIRGASAEPGGDEPCTLAGDAESVGNRRCTIRGVKAGTSDLDPIAHGGDAAAFGWDAAPGGIGAPCIVGGVAEFGGGPRTRPSAGVRSAASARTVCAAACAPACRTRAAPSARRRGAPPSRLLPCGARGAVQPARGRLASDDRTQRLFVGGGGRPLGGALLGAQG